MVSIALVFADYKRWSIEGGVLDDGLRDYVYLQVAEQKHQRMNEGDVC